MATTAWFYVTYYIMSICKAQLASKSALDAPDLEGT